MPTPTIAKKGRRFLASITSQLLLLVQRSAELRSRSDVYSKVEYGQIRHRAENAMRQLNLAFDQLGHASTDWNPKPHATHFENPLALKNELPVSES